MHSMISPNKNHFFFTYFWKYHKKSITLALEMHHYVYR